MGKTLATSSQNENKSPKQGSEMSPTHTDSQNPPSRPDSTKAPAASAEPPTKPLAPPPRSGQQNGNAPDYFSVQVGGSLSLEPNPFEQSFGGAPETPGGTKLPPVASLTSPSSLLPGGGSTPFNWGGGSLRTGPLSPAMLSGPAGDYYADTHLRGGFPTPNESSLRTGLTPGGSGSMFPAPSPSSQALFAQLQNGSATPNPIDFHRTAMAAATAKRDQQNQQASQQHHVAPTSQPSVTSQPQEHPSSTSTSGPPPAPVPKMDPKPLSGPFDPHDNDAANGLYLLAQGRNSAQPQAPYAAPPPQQPAAMKPSASPVLPPTNTMHATQAPGPMSQSRQQSSPANGHVAMNGSAINGTPATGGDGSADYGGTSEAGSPESDRGDMQRATSKGKGKRNSTSDAASATNGRRKAQDTAAKNSPPSKKLKTSSTASSVEDGDGYSDEEDGKDGQPKQKMTEDEKRKNFLERNRVAALKCRQRKKQWLASLQSKVELFTTENEALSSQITQLREEVVHLKTLLLAHKDCPITQQQGMHGAFVQQSMEPYGNSQINPYGMSAQMSAQQGMPAQVDQRRYSEARMA